MSRIVKVVMRGAALVALVAGRSLPGQQPKMGASCDSVLRAARVDSTRVTARAYLLRLDGGPFPTRARELVLESILGHFVAPRPLVLPVFSPGAVRTRMFRPVDPADSVTARAPMLYGAYLFTILSTGAITAVTTTIQTLAPAFDTSVKKAIADAAGDSALAIVVRGLETDSLQLELRITTGPEDPRLRVPPVALFSAVLPVVRLVDAKPNGALHLPEYPESERDEGRDGEALLRAIVDERGTVVVSTLEVQHATSSAFALAAALTFVEYHFIPAHIDGCLVPQVVEMPFWFSLRP